MLASTVPFPLLLLLSLLTFPTSTLSDPDTIIPVSLSTPIPTPTPPPILNLPIYFNVRKFHNRKTNPNLLKEWALREKGKVNLKYELELAGDDDDSGSSSGGEQSTLEKRRKQKDIGRRATTQLATAGYGPTPTTLSDAGSTDGIGSSSGNSTASRTTLSASATNTVGAVKIYNEQDSEYFASVGVGVPPQYMNVILDTGSADLWLASSLCTNQTGCISIPTYNSTLSVTSTDVGTPFSVRYGSGAASGIIYTDFVGFGGYNVSSQGFALVDNVSNGLISGNVSGLMGLGWQSLAASGVTPFWQNLYQASVLPFPGFAVQLTRYVNSTIYSSSNQTNQSIIEPGGSLTLGYLNTSLYSSEINYIPLPSVPTSGQSYWLIPMEAIQINSTNVTGLITNPSPGIGGGLPLVAIDTGTTLIGGPQSVVSALYAMIPGALRATGVYAGYYSYPCHQVVNVTLVFGGKLYNMTSDDFNLGSFGQQGNVSTCLGAFFDLNLSSTSKISWVIGAAFLKNVYSVYRASPPAVGFATLSTNITSSNSSSSHSNNNNNNNGGGGYNITFPAGIFGPSAVIVQQPSLQTSVMADTITTAITAGQTVSKNNSGASASVSFVRSSAMMLMLLLVGGGVVMWG